MGVNSTRENPRRHDEEKKPIQYSVLNDCMSVFNDWHSYHICADSIHLGSGETVKTEKVMFHI